jgi:DNA damage-binding protein 1
MYLFGTIAPQYQDLLLRLQTNLENLIEPVGGVTFGTYRAFHNPERAGEGPYRFVYGELLESFLDMDVALQAEVCKGLGPSVEDVRNMVENLKRMH